MADRIGILRDGKLVEEGTPEEIYNRPKTLFSATFLGEANIFSGTWTGNELTMADGSTLRVAASTALQQGQALQCAVRPERIRLQVGEDGLLDNSLRGTIARRIFAGGSSTVTVDCRGVAIRVVVPNAGDAPLRDGEAVVLTWAQDSTIALDAS